MYQEHFEKFKFNPSRAYLFDTKDVDIFKNNENPLLTLYKLQCIEYKHLLQYLLLLDDRELENATFNEKDYIDSVKKGEITLNQEGLLTKDDKYLVPSKLRIPLLLYYHKSSVIQHRGTKLLIDIFNNRFFWIGMISDIKIFTQQCMCQAAKVSGKEQVGYKDKGPQSVYYAIQQNQVLYLDLYGALPDGNYAASIVDGFDGYLVSSALKPIYDITAFGIIKFIIFEWILIYGIPQKIISDNGTNLISKLNKLFALIFNIKHSKIFAYSPWVNGQIEITMKGINQAIYIENMRRELIGLSKYRKSIRNIINDKEYRILIKTAAMIHNNTIKDGTGFKPRELRFISGHNILLDLELENIYDLNKEEYVKIIVLIINYFMNY